MKLQKWIYNIANYTIRILFGVIVFGLCLQSMFSTSFIGVITKEDGSLQERTLNIADSPLKHLVIAVLFMAALVLMRKVWQRAKKTTKWSCYIEKMTASRLLKIFSIIVGAAGVFWILATQLKAGSDPAKIYALAMQWRENDFSGFAEGGYLFRYPYQAGIVLFYYFLSFLFGVDNFIALQLVNVAALLCVYYLLAKLAGYYWKEDAKIQIAVFLGLALWIPILFYITYLYGILLGMACSLAAVYLAVKYLETRKYRYMFVAALCMGIATVFKMNCLIYLVAISCFLVYDMIVTSGWKNKLRSLLFIVLMILSVQGCNQAVYSYVENLSGYETPEGEVMVSWIVMGLQDTPIGPGHYSGYIGDVFVKYNYDTEKITEASISDIKKILTRMSENPLDEGIPFFARKNAFQWNDPTFIGMKLNADRISAIDMPGFAESIIDGEASVALSVCLNYIQTLILLGALGYIILHWRSKNLYELFGGVIFIGGYLFHSFWESSSSYTIPYFVMLIPYAVKGWLDLVRIQISPNPKAGRRYFMTCAAIIVWGILLLNFSRTNLFANTIALDDGEDARNQFYHRNQTEATELEDNYYTVSPYLAEEVALTEQGGAILTEPVSDELAQKIAFSTKEKGKVIRFRDSEQVLAVLPGESNRLTTYMDDSMNMFYDFDLEADYQWTVVAAENGVYYLVLDGMALTYEADSDQIHLEEYAQKDSQKWLIR
ncbi:MAG: hypothetical protein PUD93_00265 [Lachnospiraceae bacterium]|nr:hypothetical protein [Lachnospiraceae bacterium]